MLRYIFLSEAWAPANPGTHAEPLYVFYVGRVGVGWHRRCKTRQSLRELDNQGTVTFFFWRSLWLAGELDHWCGIGNLNSA